MLEEMSGYYVLGYHTSRSDSELPGKAPSHAIRVRVLRDGLIVHARNTLLGFEERSITNAPQTREQYLQQTLLSPFTSGGLRVSIEPAFAPSAPDPKTCRRAIDLSIHMTVENAIEANSSALTLDTSVALLRADGTTAAASQREVKLSEIAREQVDRYRRFGIRFSVQLEEKQPGNYQFRAAVRNPATGQSGSAYTFLAIPDFNKDRLAFATPIEGEMPLPVDVPPGEYAIRLITWDRGAGPSKPTGNYWSPLKVSSAF